MNKEIQQKAKDIIDSGITNDITKSFFYKQKIYIELAQAYLDQCNFLDECRELLELISKEDNRTTFKGSIDYLLFRFPNKDHE